MVGCSHRRTEGQGHRVILGWMTDRDPGLNGDLLSGICMQANTCPAVKYVWGSPGTWGSSRPVGTFH